VLHEVVEHRQQLACRQERQQCRASESGVELRTRVVP
jgi:hypothetical protein